MNAPQSTKFVSAGIIKAQRKEIKEMEWLLNDVSDNGEATTQAEAAERPVPTSKVS